MKAINKVVLLCLFICFVSLGYSQTNIDAYTNTYICDIATEKNYTTNMATIDVASVISFGSVTIYLATGEVVISDDTTISEAALEFWEAVEKSYPEYFNNRKE